MTDNNENTNEIAYPADVIDLALGAVRMNEARPDQINILSQAHADKLYEMRKVKQANMIASASYLAEFYSNDDLVNLDMRQALIEERGMNPALTIAFEEQSLI